MIQNISKLQTSKSSKIRLKHSSYILSYMHHICSIIAKAQITNGGPVILFQPENEYSAAVDVPFPNHKYLKYVNDQARKAGIVVPLVNNDAWQGSTGAPGTGPGAVDIYVSPFIEANERH